MGDLSPQRSDELCPCPGAEAQGYPATILGIPNHDAVGRRDLYAVAAAAIAVAGFPPVAHLSPTSQISSDDSDTRRHSPRRVSNSLSNDETISSVWKTYPLATCSHHALSSATMKPEAFAGWAIGAMTCIVTFGRAATADRCASWSAMIAGDPTRRQSASWSITNHADGGLSRMRTRRCRSIRADRRVATTSAVMAGWALIRVRA